MGLLQHQVLPLLERLSQLLEDKASFLTNTGNQHMSGTELGILQEDFSIKWVLWYVGTQAFKCAENTVLK